MPSKDHITNLIGRIRQRSTETLADLERITQDGDKTTKSDLAEIRRLSLSIIEKTNNIHIRTGNSAPVG